MVGDKKDQACHNERERMFGRMNLSSLGRLQQERHCLEMENCIYDNKWCVPVLGKKIDTVSLALS